MKNSNNTSLFQREQVRESLKQSLIKLHPGMMMRNPIMFTVEIATMIMLLVTVYSLFSDGQGDFLYNLVPPPSVRQFCRSDCGGPGKGAGRQPAQDA